MDDITYLSRPRPLIPPAHKLSLEEFLINYDEHPTEWLTDGTVEVLAEETITHIQMRFDLVELFDVFVHSTGWGHQLTRFLMRTAPTLPVRRPDILLTAAADLEKILQSCFYGAADIVVEIVSADSVGRDYGVKFREYEAGGIKEYWLIDPDRRTADVHERGADGRFVRRRPDDHGRITSGVLDKFALDPELLWTGQKVTNAQTLNLVADMLGVPVDSLLK